MQVGDALVGVDHREGRALGDLGVDRGLDRVTVGQRAQAVQDGAQTVVGRQAGGGQGLAVTGEGLREEGTDHVAEDDRVGDLHHRGLEVHREQHALGLGTLDLVVQEGAQRVDVQDGRVHDLTGEDRYGLAQHGGGAVGGDVLDAQGAGFGDDGGLLGGAEVVLAHGGDVRLRLGGPGAHAVRVRLGVVLDRGGGAAVGVALAQDRVDGAALDLVVAGADVALLVGLRVVRVVREGVALALELGDRGLELRDRGRDVRKLDDVGFRGLRQLAELGEGVGDPLALLEVLREDGDDPTGQGDVTGLDIHTGRRRVCLDHRQEGIRREGRGLVSVRVDDGRVSHRMLRSTVCVSRLQHCSTSRYLVIGPLWTAPCRQSGRRVSRGARRAPEKTKAPPPAVPGQGRRSGIQALIRPVRQIRRRRPSGPGRTGSAAADRRSPRGR